MDIFALIAERRICEAMQRGEFDHLRLKGEKIDLKPNPFVPTELRMGFTILKNAGLVPEELSLNSELRSLNELLDTCLDTVTEQQVRERIRTRLLQLNYLLEKRGRSPALQDYIEKLEGRG